MFSSDSLVIDFIFCLVISFIDDSTLAFVSDAMTLQRHLTSFGQLLHGHGGLPTQCRVFHMVVMLMRFIESRPGDILRFIIVFSQRAHADDCIRNDAV